MSLGVNVYALAHALNGSQPAVSGLFWALHIGIFICFFPAVRSKQKIIEEQTRSLGYIERAVRGGWMMWSGIKLWPFVVLWFYGAATWGALYEFDAFQEQPPWLLFSTVWMAFYYVSWALLRQEVHRREDTVV